MTTRYAETFRVNGIPKAQPRPRAWARKIGKVHIARIYEDGTAEKWKADVILGGRDVKPKTPLEGPLRVEITFYLPRPKRLMRKKDPEDAVWCIAKPDRDNLEKAVLDALKTDGWFRDDCQVVSGEIRKLYHEKAGIPGAVISIFEH